MGCWVCRADTAPTLLCSKMAISDGIWRVIRMAMSHTTWAATIWSSFTISIRTSTINGLNWIRATPIFHFTSCMANTAPHIIVPMDHPPLAHRLCFKADGQRSKVFTFDVWLELRENDVCSSHCYNRYYSNNEPHTLFTCHEMVYGYSTTIRDVIRTRTTQPRLCRGPHVS